MEKKKTDQITIYLITSSFELSFSEIYTYYYSTLKFAISIFSVLTFKSCMNCHCRVKQDIKRITISIIFRRIMVLNLYRTCQQKKICIKLVYLRKAQQLKCLNVLLSLILNIKLPSQQKLIYLN
jgi:hypothetical protein